VPGFTFRRCAAPRLAGEEAELADGRGSHLNEADSSVSWPTAAGSGPPKERLVTIWAAVRLSLDGGAEDDGQRRCWPAPGTPASARDDFNDLLGRASGVIVQRAQLAIDLRHGNRVAEVRLWWARKRQTTKTDG